MKINLSERYSYDELLSVLIRLYKNYPHILQLFSIGQSEAGRELLVARFGRGIEGTVMLGGVHGRESINPIVLIATLARDCGIYSSGQKADWRPLLDQYCIYYIPLLNPDGYEIARTDENRYLHKGNERGVDLNRDFACRSAGQHNRVFSEGETRAFRQFCETHPTLGCIDFHSRGECIYYYRSAMDSGYNQRQRSIAEQLKKITGYRMCAPEEEHPIAGSGGNSVNYYSETFGKPAITIETVPEEAAFPLHPKYQRAAWDRIKDVPVWFLKENI